MNIPPKCTNAAHTHTHTVIYMCILKWKTWWKWRQTYKPVTVPTKWAAPTDRHILASKQIRQDKYDDIEKLITHRNEHLKATEEVRNSNEFMWKFAWKAVKNAHTEKRTHTRRKLRACTTYVSIFQLAISITYITYHHIKTERFREFR